jgi:hypothetical protein
MANKNINEEKPEKNDPFSFIDSLEITDLQKHFLRSRWLEQMKWMSAKSKSSQKKYYLLRLIAIVGGVIVPALVSMNISDEGVMTYIRYLTFIVSLLVAISVAVEEFFHYGERWRHYRNTAERLKIEGWEFFQLSGSYKEYKVHGNAYTAFASKVEEILREEVGVYMSEIARDKKKTEPVSCKIE